MTISWSGVRGGPGQGSAEMVARVESSSRAGRGIREEGYCWRVCVCVCVHWPGNEGERGERRVVDVL